MVLGVFDPKHEETPSFEKVSGAHDGGGIWASGFPLKASLGVLFRFCLLPFGHKSNYTPLCVFFSVLGCIQEPRQC